MGGLNAVDGIEIEAASEADMLGAGVDEAARGLIGQWHAWSGG